MKIIKKSRLTNGQINHLNDPEKIMNEIAIMKAVQHVSRYNTIEKLYVIATSNLKILIFVHNYF